MPITTPLSPASFHELARKLKAAKPAPFALQVGAMDGVRFDLLRPHLKEGGWRGLLIEPVPHMFEALRNTYAAQPQIECANCAIADYEGEMKMQYFDPAAVTAGLIPEQMLGMSTSKDRKAFASANMRQRHPDAIRDHAREISVPCCTLPALLERHNVTEIDLFLVDTEGTDWQVARQLDLDRYSPAIFCIEHPGLSAADLDECHARFTARGYRFGVCVEDIQNVIFYKDLP